MFNRPEYIKNWKKNHKHSLRVWFKKYFQKTKKNRLKSTQKWRNSLSPNWQLTDYSESTLMTFSKSKLIQIIRSQEDKIKELENVSSKHHKK